MSTLKRDEAHALVDAAYLGEDALSLRELAEAWDVAGNWNENTTPDQWYDALHEHVDQCATSDEARSRGPRDDDDTGLVSP